MKLYLEKLPKLREMVFFTKEDLEEIWIKNEVFNKWLKRKYIKEINYNLFSLSEEHIIMNEETYLYLFQKIDPSIYLTHLYALRHQNFWFWEKQTKFFSTKNKDLFKKYEEEWRIKCFYNTSNIWNEEDFIFENYQLSNWPIWVINYKKIKMAKLELALIEFFIEYWYIIDEDTIDAIGFIPDEINKKIDKKKLINMSLKFDITIQETVKNFINWLNSWNYERDTIIW